MPDDRRATVAAELLRIAAWISTISPLGWASPYCEALEEAARLLRGDGANNDLVRDDGMLSEDAS